MILIKRIKPEKSKFKNLLKLFKIKIDFLFSMALFSLFYYLKKLKVIKHQRDLTDIKCPRNYAN